MGGMHLNCTLILTKKSPRLDSFPYFVHIAHGDYGLVGGSDDGGQVRAQPRYGCMYWREKKKKVRWKMNESKSERIEVLCCVNIGSSSSSSYPIIASQSLFLPSPLLPSPRPAPCIMFILSTREQQNIKMSRISISFCFSSHLCSYSLAHLHLAIESKK